LQLRATFSLSAHKGSPPLGGGGDSEAKEKVLKQNRPYGGKIKDNYTV